MLMNPKLLWSVVGLVALLLVGMCVSLLTSRPLFDEPLDHGTLGRLAIAAPSQALTFARFREAGELRVMLVTHYENGTVSGIHLNRHFALYETDTIQLFNTLGYEAIAQASTSMADQITVGVAQLELPFDAPARNIGIGANYREHARESGIEEQPFVFPKIAQPTIFSSDIEQSGSLLLDYEAELGLVALYDISSPGAAQPYMGLVLCNELTDRWTLVKHIDRNQPMGTTGFAEGKSREGFASIGGLLVIPRDLETFYKQIELRLYVNGHLRQREVAGNMVWGPRKVLTEIFRRVDWRFQYYDTTVPLLESGQHIRAGSIIFSGTPAGVIFKPTNIWNPWLYLQPGDEVVIRSDYLGIIHNRVVE